MPGAVPRSSTFALTNATTSFILALADKGWRRALHDDLHLPEWSQCAQWPDHLSRRCRCAQAALHASRSALHVSTNEVIE
jgi:hypothetical protein